MTSAQKTYRILDANFNRSREGLRVCEEICRFVLEEKSLTRRFKTARHRISDVLKKLPISAFKLVAARDASKDVGREASRLEAHRQDALGLFMANSERVKEALRVLEESSKLLDLNCSNELKKVRFYVYTLEKNSLRKLETLRHH